MRAGIYILAAAFMLQVLGACQSRLPEGFPEGVNIESYRRPSADQIPYRLREKLARDDIPRMVELGRKLFFEPRLSRHGLTAGWEMSPRYSLNCSGVSSHT